MSRVSSTILAALACASSVFAASRAAAQATDPGQPDQLAFFVGDWNCTGKASASSTIPPPATAGRFQVEKAVADRWIHIRYDEDATATNQDPIHLGEYMGYDPVKQQFLAVGVDGTEAYDTQSSAGWNGDSLTFEGTVYSSGSTAGLRDVYTRKGPDDFTHSGAAQGRDRQWIETDEETCRRIK